MHFMGLTVIEDDNSRRASSLLDMLDDFWIIFAFNTFVT